MYIGIIGLGNFGTALAQHLSSYNKKVIAYAREAEIVASIISDRKNPHYLSQVKLNQNLEVTSDKSNLSDCDLLVLAVPSRVLSAALEGIKPKKGAVMVSAVKGIDSKTGETPIDCIEKLYAECVQSAVISGPGFASDLVAGKHAGLVAAAKSERTVEKVGSVFSHGNIRIYYSLDPVGVELGGIIKNIIAIAAGIVDGLGLGDSARAGLITRGLAEMRRLAEKMGARPETLFGLSGLGDLVLTATCDQSRNRTVGLELGKGKSLESVVSSLGSVAEGVTTTRLVYEFSRKFNIEMPITEQVKLVLDQEIDPTTMVSNLMSRPVKYETK